MQIYTEAAKHMRIITDSAADFTPEELNTHGIECVSTQIIFGDEVFTAGKDLSDADFWARLMAGENAKTSQPAPEAFLKVFEAAKADGEEAVCICLSSALSGTLQSARVAASMVDYDRIHIVDSLCGAAAQKLLVLYACRLRDEGRHIANEIVKKIEALRSRVHLLASLDTLENLARSGRIPKALANLGSLAQLKPLLEVSRDGRIVLGGKAFGRHRAIDSLAKRIASLKLDPEHPIIPFYSYNSANCMALIERLRHYGVSIDEKMLSALGTAISPHIGPNAYGAAFIIAE